MRIARFTRILAAVIAVGGLTGAPVARAAEPAPPARARTSSVAVARIAPAIALVEPGGLVTASILITDVAGLYGADVRLTFDPTLVQVVDADPAVSGVQVSPGPLLASPFIALHRVENTTGTIGFAATMLNPSLPITGGGVLYLVQFRGVLTGETTLAISYAELSTRTGGTLARSLENGLIKVGPILRLWLPSISR